VVIHGWALSRGVDASGGGMAEAVKPTNDPNHQIAPGVYGWLESPRSHAVVRDCVIVAGWAFAETATIAEVSVRGFGPSRMVPYPSRRDDVALVYPGNPEALRSGFSAYIQMDHALTSAVCLEVWATFSDGRSLRLFERKLRPGDPAGDASMAAMIWPIAAHLIQHPRTLASPLFWRQVMTRLGLGPSARQSSMAAARRAIERAAKAALREFLINGPPLRCPHAERPIVSVVIVVWNHAALTLRCLHAVIEQTGVPIEIIVVDNNSTDETRRLLSRVEGTTVLTNASNLGFTVAANAGSKVARGEFVLFLNNDAELTAGSIERLVNTIRRSPEIGAVGGKLVLPDGSLQEAGSIIWLDGSCEGYGRGEDPRAPAFAFERDVDFCSGALLLTRRDLFATLGGFDERYRPAYYEDADYCVRLWKQHRRVVYEPLAGAIHLEFGSASSSDKSIALQAERRRIFIEQHGHWLSGQASRDRGARTARSHPHGGPTALVIDDAVPIASLGAGFPRAAALLQALMELGYAVTLYPTKQHDQSRAQADVFPTLEVTSGGVDHLGAFVRDSRFDLVIVSRPHNMRYVRVAAGADLTKIQAPVVYDAEAIFALRELGRRALVGRAPAGGEAQSMVEQELELARGCAAVLTVSRLEQQRFAEADIRRVFVVAHAVEPKPTPRSFESRHGILFVGAFGGDSPNEDAALFLVNDVMPALKETSIRDVQVRVAGARLPERLQTLDRANVSWHSDVEDLTPFYDTARVFVAPTRYSAGIPLKVIEAAARGLPVVCTPSLAAQLEWEHGVELLTAASSVDFAREIERVYSDADLWWTLRQSALARVGHDHDPNLFRERLRACCDSTRRPVPDTLGVR
jgi:GT2 family glycosyltransferase